MSDLRELVEKLEELPQIRYAGSGEGEPSGYYVPIKHVKKLLESALAAASPGTQGVSADILQQFPVKREWAHDKLENVLIGAAGLLDVIKGEWAEEWSEWDQSVRNGITLQLALLHPSGQGLATAQIPKQIGDKLHIWHEEKCWLAQIIMRLDDANPSGQVLEHKDE